ncbi:MAG: hypothetical protein U1F16_05315 [Turneriella sp.]
MPFAGLGCTKRRIDTSQRQLSTCRNLHIAQNTFPGIRSVLHYYDECLQKFGQSVARTSLNLLNARFTRAATSAVRHALLSIDGRPFHIQPASSAHGRGHPARISFVLSLSGILVLLKPNRFRISAKLDITKSVSTRPVDREIRHCTLCSSPAGIFIYLLATIIIGFVAARRIKTVTGALADKRLSFFMASATVFATWFWFRNDSGVIR